MLPRAWAPAATAGLAGTTGAIGCFSFNANKIVTCAGGGMIVATPV